MTQEAQTIITIISALTALIAALFARQAVKTAEKSYSVELISLLYTTYQSKRMFKDLKIVWEIYHQIWEKDGNAKENANNGVPVRLESAWNFFSGISRDSKEFRAIHNMINYWTYIELLLKKGAITTTEIIAFTEVAIF